MSAYWAYVPPVPEKLDFLIDAKLMRMYRSLLSISLSEKPIGACEAEIAKWQENRDYANKSIPRLEDELKKRGMLK